MKVAEIKNIDLLESEITDNKKYPSTGLYQVFFNRDKNTVLVFIDKENGDFKLIGDSFPLAVTTFEIPEIQKKKPNRRMKLR